MFPPSSWQLASPVFGEHVGVAPATYPSPVFAVSTVSAAAALSVPSACVADGAAVWHVVQSAVAMPRRPSASKLPSCAFAAIRENACSPVVGLTAVVVTSVWQAVQ